MFNTILIANRGEIACRIARTCARLGIRSIAVYSDADADAHHTHEADEAIRIGPADAAASYLDANAIITAAKAISADAIHPGYGFLSEQPVLAELCAHAGIAWIGPRPEAIKAMGSKIAAKRIAQAAAVPSVPGYHGDDQSIKRLQQEAERIGFPLLIKASAGGGGKGMRRVDAHVDFSTRLAEAKHEHSAPSATAGAVGATDTASTAPRSTNRRRSPRHARAPVRARVLGAAQLPETDRGGSRRAAYRGHPRETLHAGPGDRSGNRL
jgi:acetyl/propionyl-CoA carboxylase alpha subunit